MNELADLLVLASAYCAASLSWVTMKTTDTALIGHVGTRFLDAAAYADLYMSSTGVFVQGRVLGVFCSQAFGARNTALVGTWLKVSLVVLGCLSVPVVVAWALARDVLGAFGLANWTARKAGYYAMVLAFCIPGRVGFAQISQFFTAQRRGVPSFAAAPCAVVANGLAGYFAVQRYGFAACPVVTTLVEYLQLAIALCFLSRTKCRPHAGWWSSADLTRPRFSAFGRLYAPAVAAVASDYWRLTAVGALAASLSKDDLGVFNASYRVMWISLTVAGSLGAAIGTKIAIGLGENDPAKARAQMRLGLTTALVLLFCVAALVAAIPRTIGAIFTSDPHLLHSFDACRFPLAATVFAMNLAVVLETVPVACGRTKVVFYCGFLASWAGQVPAVFVLINFWRRDLVGLFSGVAAGYGLLVVLYFILILTSDFDAYAQDATFRSESCIDAPLLDDLIEDPTTARQRPPPRDDDDARSTGGVSLPEQYDKVQDADDHHEDGDGATLLAPSSSSCCARAPS